MCVTFRAFLASQVLWLDQADARAVAEGEEVTLMDWGNAIIRVRMSADNSVHSLLLVLDLL